MGITTQTDHGLSFNGNQMYIQHNHPDNPITLLTLHNGAGMDVMGNIKSANQVRATGWFTGDASNHPLALEIGVSGGRGWIMAYDRSANAYGNLSIQSNLARLDMEATGHVSVGALSFHTTAKKNLLGTADWSTVGTSGPSRLHFNAHDKFWIGAGNGTWFTGTANAKQTSGLAADAIYAHDVLITTMYSDHFYDRGITFAATLDDNVNNGYRLGKWHSGDATDSSMLAIDGGLRVKGGYTDEYDYYGDDYSAYRSTRAGGSYWTGDNDWNDPSITASTAIQIQSGNNGQNTRNPALQFHQYGYGGVQIRYEGPADTLHVESTGIERFDQTRFKTDHGYIELGPKNGSHAHIYTDRPNFYFNKQLSVNGSTVWNSGNDGSGSGLDADKVDGLQASSFLRSDTGDSATGSINFTNEYYAFGDRTGSVSNDGNWHARVNVAGWGHARVDTKCVSDGIITTMLAHTGHGAGKIGTMSDHPLHLMADGTSHATLNTAGLLSTTVQGTLWGSSNDGSGSGLDADLLDGEQGSYYNQSQFTGSSFISRSNGNVVAVDNATTNTIGYVNGTAAAGYSDGAIFSAAYSTSWVGQIFSNFRDGHIAVRGKNNGAWQSWHKVWDSGNDGTNSGLDADKLDSFHASSFIRSDADNTGHIRSTGYVSGSRLYAAGDRSCGYFFNDTDTRVSFTGGDFYIQSSVGNCYLYATNTYLGSTSGDNIITRGNTISGNSWSITGGGVITTAGTVDGRDVSVDGAKLDGIAAGANNYSFPHTITDGSTASTVVKRNSSGDINARLFRSEYDTTNASIGFIMTQVDTAGNNYIRPSTMAQVRSSLGVPTNTGSGASGNWEISITGLAANASNAFKLDNLDSTDFVRVDGVADIDMNDNNINYVHQLHFNDNLRFVDDGNDNYLDFKWGDVGAGGIRFFDGNNKLHGYVYGDGAGRFGLLDDDSSWSVKVGIDSEPLTLYCNTNPELYVYDSYVYAPGSFRAPTFYVDGNIYHNGDTNTYIGFHNTDQFRVVAGGNEQMEWGNGYTLMNDNKELRLGTGSDFRMWFSGSHTYFRNYSLSYGNIYFQGQDPTGVNKALLYMYTDTSNDSHIRGYHNSNEVFRTKSSGTLQVGNPNNTGNENGELQLTAYQQTNYSLDVYKDVNNVYGHGSNTMIFRVFQGSSGVASFNAGDGSFRSTGDIIAYSSSDVRLKDNIKTIDNAIDKVLVLNGCEFDWNDKQSTHRGSDVGLIAQDVEQVVPQAVRTNDDGYKSVRYEKMVPLLVQSIKEQQQQIDQQQQQIEQLLRRVERLEK